MNLFAILISDDIPIRCSSIRTHHDSISEHNPHDGCPGFRRLRWLKTLRFHRHIPTHTTKQLRVRNITSTVIDLVACSNFDQSYLWKLEKLKPPVDISGAKADDAIALDE
jgi:hypothetical protein